MKVGIVTLIGENNYGNLLQSYAMQTVLERIGHQVLILNRRKNHPTLRLLFLRILSFFKSLLHRYLLNDKEILIVNPFGENYGVKNRADCSRLKTFAAQYQNRTKPLCSSSEMMKYARKEQLDAYVVGSDQVWREEYTLSIEEMFLSFLPDSCRAKRVAYAASFGTDDHPISSDKLPVCAGLLKRFDAVSVREKSAIDMCKTLFDVESVHVLDPTMLLTLADYKMIFEKAGTPSSPGTLLTYILDENEDIKRKIAQFANNHNWVPFRVNALEKIESRSYTYRLPSVESWLRGFYDAEFVITDSFHACVFSILFNKPFICLGNKCRGNARFDSLLQMFGLEDRWEDDMDDYIVMQNEIDWKRVNRVLEQKRKESIDFLKRAVSTIS